MTRRAIIIIISIVVVLYFSVIFFILRPLQNHNTGNYLYLSRFGMKRTIIPGLEWCKKLKMMEPPFRNVVALASFPGSGNTWLRYLLQQVSGILTGSIYLDYGLRMYGFPAESVSNGSVLVVKTHETPPRNNKFHSAILLIRHPRDALLADYNRMHKGHIGTAPRSAFKISESNLRWQNYVASQVLSWESFHKVWLSEFKGPLHIVYYEHLVANTKTALEDIFTFLQYNVTESDITCALNHKEGIYRRRNKHNFDPFTALMYSHLQRVNQAIFDLVHMYDKEHKRTSQLKAVRIS